LPLSREYRRAPFWTVGDEELEREICYTLEEERVLIERWLEKYNRVRPQVRWDTAHRPRRRAALRRPRAKTCSLTHRSSNGRQCEIAGGAAGGPWDTIRVGGP